MTREATELLRKVLLLPVKARAALAARLIESLDELDETVDDDVEAAWQHEIDRRVRDLDEGVVRTVPWAEARRQILED